MYIDVKSESKLLKLEIGSSVLFLTLKVIKVLNS